MWSILAGVEVSNIAARKAHQALCTSERARERTTCVGMNEECSTLIIAASSYVNMKQAHGARQLDECYYITLISFWWSEVIPFRIHVRRNPRELFVH
jgi:hypothetical protein